MHPGQVALCRAVTRNPPLPPRPPPEPRVLPAPPPPHLGAQARPSAPPRAAGASPEPRAARTGQQDPRREPQPQLGRCRRRRRFRPCHDVTRGGRSRRDRGGAGSPPSPPPRGSPRPDHFRRCAKPGRLGRGGRGLCAAGGAGPGAELSRGRGSPAGAAPGAAPESAAGGRTAHEVGAAGRGGGCGDQRALCECECVIGIGNGAPHGVRTAWQSAP